MGVVGGFTCVVGAGPEVERSKGKGPELVGRTVDDADFL